MEPQIAEKSWRLILQDGPEEGREIPLAEVLSIGRADGNDLILSSASVSRRHARITRRGENFIIEDLGSAHGTSVGGERVTTRELRPGDLIGVGPLRMKFLGPGPEAAPVDTGEVLVVHDTVAAGATSVSTLRAGARATGFNEAMSRLEALLQVGLALQQERVPGRLLERIARTLLDTLDVDRCGIFLRGDAGPAIVLSRQGIEHAVDLPFSRTLLNRALERGEALVTADAGRDGRLAGASIVAGNLRSAMVTPLWGRERILGAVVIEHRGRAGVFDAEDLRLLSALGNLAGTALENAHLIEEVRRETEERSALARFLSPAVAEQIRGRGLSQGLAGERREITVLFTDIRGFTSLSERLPPDELIDALNRTFATQVEAVLEQEGTIDKFTGDGLLALFGAPLQQDDHAARALTAAVAIRERSLALATKSGAPLPIGIAIASGEATVGPVGSSRRMEYTAIGDVVNIAARLVAMAEGGEILLTAESARAAGVDATTQTMGGRKVKGREGEVDVRRYN